MSMQLVPFVNGVALSAAFFVFASPALAGDRVHSPPPVTVIHQAPAAPVVHRVAPTTVLSFVMKPPPQAKEPLRVKLRGPDGQVRRFAVVGGRAAIEYSRPVVLRPGQSVTFRLASR